MYIEQIVGLYHDYCLYAGVFDAVEREARTQECLDARGRLWRNPRDREAGEDYQNACSRDMLLGLLLSRDPASCRALYRYLLRNDWLLCPDASDNRNQVGLTGRCYLSLIGGTGWERLLAPMLGIVLFLSAVAPVKKPFELHLSICALLLHKKMGRWGLWERLAFKVLNYASPRNAIIAYIKEDITLLRHVGMGLEWEEEGDYQDHWPFASYEPWRDARMAHPAALDWVLLAIKDLENTNDKE